MAVVLAVWAVLAEGVIALFALSGAVPPTVGPPAAALAALVVSLGGLAAAGFATYAASDWRRDTGTGCGGRRACLPRCCPSFCWAC